MKKSLLLVFAAIVIFSGCDIIEQLLDLNTPPTISIEGGTNFTIALEERISLNANGSRDPDNDMISFSWEVTQFPAGASLSDYFFNSVGGVAEFSGSVAGEFVITLVAYDELEESSVDIIITVQNAPVADAGGDFDVAVGTSALFDASASSDEEGDIVSYLWDFGDGTAEVSTTNPEATHTYITEGEYTVALTVTDEGGSTDTVEITVTVTAAESVVTLSIVDKSTGEPLDGATVAVAGADDSEVLTGSTYDVHLPDGVFTIYAEKEGYRTEAVALSVSVDVDVTLELKPVTSGEIVRELVSGVVTSNSAALAVPFSVGVSRRGVTEFFEVDNAAGDGAFDVNANTGDIVISAVLSDGNDEITDVTYLAKQTLEAGEPLADQALDFSAAPTRFAGTKNQNGDLKVRLDTRALVAMQPARALDEDFDFDIDLIDGNSIALESIYTNLDTTFFTKVAAGSAGATDVVVDFSLVPTSSLTANTVTDGFIVSFEEVAGADFYEAYVLEATDTGAAITYHAVIAGGTELGIPASAINPDAVAAKAFVAAVTVPAYDEALLLDGTLPLAQYEYAEDGVLIVDDGTTVVNALSTSGGGGRFAWLNYRTLYGFDHLVMDE